MPAWDRYGHRLLGIDIERSHEFEHEIAHGCEGIKPGWTRLSFNYFNPEAVFQYLVDAVDLVAANGWKLLPDYHFNPATGLWHHHDGPIEPPLRLSHNSRTTRSPASCSDRPRTAVRAPKTALVGYLETARQLMSAAPGWTQTNPHPGGLSAEFEHLRWFDLPEESLTP